MKRFERFEKIWREDDRGLKKNFSRKKNKNIFEPGSQAERDCSGICDESCQKDEETWGKYVL